MYTEDDPTVRPLVAAIRRLCEDLPGTEEYVATQELEFRVGKKPFAIAGLHSERKAAALSINFGPDEQQLLLDDPRFTRTPDIGQHGWVTIAQADMRNGELATLVTDSWRRVASKQQLAAHDLVRSLGDKRSKAARLVKVKTSADRSPVAPRVVVKAKTRTLEDTSAPRRRASGR
jgi:predicted DNA-binding protein (MmcQ/YjbR family)